MHAAWSVTVTSELARSTHKCTVLSQVLFQLTETKTEMDFYLAYFILVIKIKTTMKMVLVC